MKLIDLLVRELPKRGGWKEGWVVVTQDSEGYLCCWRYDNPKYNGFGWEHMSGRGLSGYFLFDDDDGLSCDNAESIVTRTQYEAELAASQKVEWIDGLPPAGCECEYRFQNVSYKSEFSRGKVIAYGKQTAFIEHWSSKNEFIHPLDNIEFRPIRSEADKKRDAAAKEMARHANDDENRGFDAGLRNCLSIYDAIAAGKIPGVKLED